MHTGTRLPVYANNFPAGTSTWNIAHYGQMIRDKRAQWFNYESKEDNYKCYGQEQPPEIDLTKIRSPHLNLIYSENDWLADLDDVQFLRSSLKGKFYNLNDNYFESIKSNPMFSSTWVIQFQL